MIHPREQRFWVCKHADPRTCAALIAENVPAASTQLSPDEWRSSEGSHPVHATVRHGVHEWARDEDGDGRCEIHCHTCEGAGAARRTFLRAFRGVHQQYLPVYGATYETMVNTKPAPPTLIRRRCIRHLSAYSDST